MNKKIGFVLGVAANLGLAGTAVAQNWTPAVTKVLAADPTDTARIQTEDGVARLRKTRYEETNEQAVVKMLTATKGIFVDMHSGSINGTQPVHRQQAACTPFTLQQNQDGSVSAVPDTANAKFITDNVGQDYRNANKPEVLSINGGTHALVMFNYRPQGANNTVRYAKVVDAQCNLVPVQNANGQTQKQVVIMQKNNDDCDMHQSGEGPGEVVSDANGVAHVTLWAGCNGNGTDDGWINDITVKAVGSAAAPTAFQIVKNFDASLAQREERSRGRCTVSDADPNTSICCWTEGNTQPQRDGTWCAAVDISAGGQTGANAKTRVLWKKQIEGQKTVSGVRTYSVRMNSTRVLSVDPTTNKLVKTDQLILYTSDLRGNNTNNRKGGRYLQQNLGVVKATKDGLEWVVPMTDVTNQMLGIDATHLTITGTLVEDDGKMVPAITFLQGSQFGGGTQSADLKVLGVDFTAKKFLDYGTHTAGAPYDRHLYSNYLGGNPGNQGRNFAGSTFIENPFAVAGSPRFLLLHALTGKDPADVEKPEIKPSSYIAFMPMMNPKAAPPPPAGEANTGSPAPANGSGGGQNSDPQPGDPDMPETPTPAAPAADDPVGASAGGFTSGCSVGTGMASGQSLFFLLVGLGLVGLARRRRA